MPAERASMRCVREILRLKAEGLSDRAIAAQHRAGTQHGERVRRPDQGGRADVAGAAGVDRCGAGDAAVCPRWALPGMRRKPEPDWAHLHREGIDTLTLGTRNLCDI